ncbi:hypothetical protein ACFL52_03285 [Candidatus Margulisiibacteriota bacterium]
MRLNLWTIILTVIIISLIVQIHYDIKQNQSLTKKRELIKEKLLEETIWQVN